jgi:hypothetical protein
LFDERAAGSAGRPEHEELSRCHPASHVGSHLPVKLRRRHTRPLAIVDGWVGGRTDVGAATTVACTLAPVLAQEGHRAADVETRYAASVTVCLLRRQAHARNFP